MLLLISKTTNLKYYVKNLEQPYSTKEGILSVKELNSNKTEITAKTNRVFIKFIANNSDKLQKIKRIAQIITPKDLGYIISKTQLKHNSKIIEAGSGSGGATIFFSNLFEKIYSFEIKKEHYNCVKKNLELFNCENVELKNENLFENIEKFKKDEIDLIFLDMINPQEIFQRKISCLKHNSYIIMYITNSIIVNEIINQVLENKNFYIEEIADIRLNKMKFKKNIFRPENKKEIDFTAYLIFIRKI